jgi:hypothetical protein
MFMPFLNALRSHGIAVSIREYLAFLGALDRGLAGQDTTAFYHLARLALVKHEALYDRFDRAFAQAFGGLTAATPADILAALDLPPDWLAARAVRDLSPEERAAIEGAGGLQALIDRLKARLAEQTGRHEGGSKWVGTAGTSPFGAFGGHPEGIRIGQAAGRTGHAVKVWDARAFREMDADRALGTRNMRVALRRLRTWAHEGATDELDMDGTVRATAGQGWLDIRTRPERRNAVRVLLFLDIGGSMDAHVRVAEELFAAARAEFGRLHVFWFHNCLYEQVWTDSRRRAADGVATAALLQRHDRRHRAIFVGDAAMSPYEVTHPGGSVEHWNAEPGAVWLARARAAWPASAWLTPLPEDEWTRTPSAGLVRRVFDDRMFPLTPEGVTRLTRSLS